MIAVFYWGLSLVLVAAGAGLGFTLEHVHHEHKGQHCRCPAHLVTHQLDPAPGTVRAGSADEERLVPAVPGPVPPVSWPALYGPRIVELEKLTHEQLLDVMIFVSGFDPEAVDHAMQLIRLEM